jgi:hypothetical protein
MNFVMHALCLSLFFFDYLMNKLLEIWEILPQYNGFTQIGKENNSNCVDYMVNYMISSA